MNIWHEATHQVLFNSPNIPVFGQIDGDCQLLGSAVVDLDEDLDGVVGGDGQGSLHAQPPKDGQDRSQKPGTQESSPGHFRVSPRCHVTSENVKLNKIKLAE